MAVARSRTTRTKAAKNKEAANENTAKRKPAKNKPAKNKPAKNKPAKNKPAKNKPAKNKPAKNKPAKKEVGAASSPPGRGVGHSSEARKRRVAQLRALVQDILPDATEKTRWKMPVFSLGKDLCYIGWSRRGLTFGLFRGGELDDPDGVLEGAGKRIRYLRIPDRGALPRRQIRQFLIGARDLAKAR